MDINKFKGHIVFDNALTFKTYMLFFLKMRTLGSLKIKIMIQLNLSGSQYKSCKIKTTV